MSIVNTEELAQLYDISTAQIYKWVKDGCPVKDKATAAKGSHKFDTKKVSTWREKRAVSQATKNFDDELLTKEEAQRRKVAAEAGLAELELAQKKGLVVDLAELERDLSNRFAELRASLRKIPERVVLRVVGQTDETTIKSIVLTEVDTVLENLADGIQQPGRN